MKKLSADSTWHNQILQDSLAEISALRDKKNIKAGDIHKLADIIELLVEAFGEMDRKLGFTKDFFEDLEDRITGIEDSIAQRIKKERLTKALKEKNRLMAITKKGWEEKYPNLAPKA